MLTLNELINEKKEDNKFMVVGSDETIHSVWPTSDGAKKECKKANSEIGGEFFSVKTVKTSDIMN